MNPKGLLKLLSSQIRGMQFRIFFFMMGMSLNSFAENPSNFIRPPQGFIENKGQITDQYRNPNKEVLYLFNGKGLNVQLKQNGFSYEMVKVEKTPIAIGVKDKTEKDLNIPEARMMDSFDYTFKTHRIDISFEGMNKNIRITPYEPSSDYINYYTGSPIRAPFVGALPPAQNPNPKNNGITHIHHYQKILYQNIYSNIDVEFILNIENPSQKFKYNFIIRPGGNIKDIKLKFAGANGTTLTDDGHITIETAYGNIDESIPYSYQLNDKNQQQTVQSKFSYTEPEAGGPAFAKATAGRQKPAANIFGIEAKNYDPNQTLVIDPAPWATYFGGSLNDYLYCVTTDKDGYVLGCGYSASSAGIATSGAYQNTLNGTSDGFIAKFNNTGILQWATYYGGPGNDYAFAVVSDTGANIIASGYTNSTSGITTSGAYQTVFGGSSDAFVAKFSSSGILQWSTYLGGSGTEIGYSVILDGINNIAVAGYSYSTSGIATSGAWQTVYGGGNRDGFVAKFTSDGNIRWATYFGGTDDDYVYKITSDADSNIYAVGSTSSTIGIATSGAHQTTMSGNYDAYIAKFNASGSLQWATYYGGAGYDYGYGIICDAGGAVFATGYTTSQTGIAYGNVYQPVFRGSSDGYLGKFNTSGTLQWGTYVGGTGNDYGMGIAVRLDGNILLSGYTISTDSFSTPGAYQTTFGGATDAFAAQINTSGILQWATYFGGSASELAYDICIDNSNNIFVAGITSSSFGIATTGAWQTTLGGNYDGFLFSIPDTTSQSPIVNNTISASQGICTGAIPQTLIGTMPSGGNGTYVYGWIGSTSGSTSGFAPVVGINNAINYSPPALINNTWFKRVVSSAGYFDTSNAVAITVGSTKLNVGFTVNQMIQCIKTNNFIFTDTTTGSNTHYWDFGNGITSTLANPNISYNFNIANAYWVKLHSSINGGCIDSAKQRVFVINNPAPTGSINGNAVVSKLTTHNYSVPATLGSSYQWLFTNGIGSSTTNNINIKWNATGIVELKVLEFSGGGCPGDTVFQSITINPGTGIDGPDAEAGLIIYPNPTSGILSFSGLYNGYQINISDMFGKQIYQTRVQQAHHHQNETEFSIDLSTFNPGIYSVQIITDQGKSFIQKIQIIK